MALAFIGIFVPILPTVPFILLAACCYSRGSQKFYNWLIKHPKFGPAVIEWRDHRIVRPRAKVASVITIALSLSFPVFVIELPLWVRVSVSIIGVSVMAFLISCPSEAPEQSLEENPTVSMTGQSAELETPPKPMSHLA